MIKSKYNNDYNRLIAEAKRFGDSRNTISTIEGKVEEFKELSSQGKKAKNWTTARFTQQVLMWH